ncbi:MAG TPA: hypothetical protein VFG41_01540 [Sphingomicrobium sp.]|jgi:hypothetical protein|nr:hypothetical protein [Sphingomicrobium sp.]
MTVGTIIVFVPLLLGLLAAQPGLVGQSVTRLVDQDEIILRVPVQPRPLPPHVEWVEKKGPKCVAAADIRHAMMSGSEIDFILTGGHRVRAELDEDCAALDFYSVFYLQSQDDRLCAGRDAIHSRMGGSCTIERFRSLVAKVRH